MVCRVCGGVLDDMGNVHEVDNGYVYRRVLLKCSGVCGLTFVDGLRQLSAHVVDGMRS